MPSVPLCTYGLFSFGFTRRKLCGLLESSCLLQKLLRGRTIKGIFKQGMGVTAFPVALFSYCQTKKWSRTEAALCVWGVRGWDPAQVCPASTGKCCLRNCSCWEVAATHKLTTFLLDVVMRKKDCQNYVKIRAVIEPLSLMSSCLLYHILPLYMGPAGFSATFSPVSVSASSLSVVFIRWPASTSWSFWSIQMGLFQFWPSFGITLMPSSNPWLTWLLLMSHLGSTVLR